MVIGSQGRSWTVRQADAGKAGAPPRLASSLGQVGAWLYEPDRAVIRAGLTGALTAAVDGVELDSGVGYVTSDRCVDVGYARRFAVTEAMPLNVKALRTWLRDRDVGRVTIKKRGVTAGCRCAASSAATVRVGRDDAGADADQGHQVCLVVRPA